MEMAMLRAEKEHEAMAAKSLQEGREDQTQNALEDTKEKIQEVKKLDETQKPEAMEAGVGLDLGELEATLRYPG